MPKLDLNPEPEVKIEQLGKSWQHDPFTLAAYYEICSRNWKEWTGIRPNKIATSIIAYQLQAEYGDYVDRSMVCNIY